VRALSAAPIGSIASQGPAPATAGEQAAPRAELAVDAAAIAHDLHTPAAVILGLCSRIESSGVTPAQAADLERLRGQARAVSRAATSLLEATRPPDAGRQPVEVCAVARQVADELAVLAQDRGAIVVVSAPHPAWVLAGRAQIESAIANLISNAVRQLDGGGCVRCSVAVERGTVEIQVADSGPGVPEAQRLTLLENYTQGEGGRGSAGLGLGIVLTTAQRLGGSLVVSDAPEGGAAFTLALPEARQARRRRTGRIRGSN
jgi:signal transduction histidine kinase